MSSKLKGIIAVIVIGVVLFIIYYFTSSHMEYNDDYATGNTTGNLYNGGLFCEYEGEVYFSNPNDKGSLYRMNMDGTEFEKLYDDTSSYINIYNDYIYYKKFNTGDNEDMLFSRTFYGICRMGVNGSKSEVIHQGMIDSMVLLGNYIYYKYYDNTDLYSLHKVKIDGEEDIKISDEDYAPMAISGQKIYFTNVVDNHNLMMLNAQTDSISTVATGNYYLPDIYNGYLYYIDMGNGRKLSRMNMSDMSVEILSDDKVINYNLSGKYGVLYYQAENTVAEHLLCRIDPDGGNRLIISTGDFSNISITKKYTYFYMLSGSDKTLMRTVTTGDGNITTFIPGVED